MSDMPSCAHLNVLYAPKDNADGTQSDAWACRDCLHPFWPQNLAVATHLAILRERNVGDSSKAARSEVVENTGDGSESAGLRRTDRVDTFFARLLSFAQRTGADADGVINNPNLDGDAKFAARAFKLLEAALTLRPSGPVFTGELAAELAEVAAFEKWWETEDFNEEYAAAKAAWLARAGLNLAPAISRPPTQGSVSEVSNILKEVCEILGVELGPGLARYVPLIQRVREIAQPHSLPPSRADLGGDRIKGSCWRCGKPVLVKAGQAWHSKDDVVWHEVCSYQSQIEELTTQIAALKTDHALAEGQQSGKLVEKTSRDTEGESSRPPSRTKVDG